MKDNKKDENKKNFIQENAKCFVCLLVGLVVGVVVMLILWPDRIAELENGEEVILSIKDHKFTANDLYKELKTINGNEALFQLVDNAILLDKYPNEEEEANNFAKGQKEAIYTTYQSYYGYTKEEFLSANGFNYESDFEKELIESYYYQKYYDEYVGSTIKDKDISKFYKESVFGDKSIYLFAAMDDNKGDLEKVQKALKDKKSFNDIKDKYSDVNAYSFESVKFSDNDTFTQVVLDKVASTKKGSYSDIFTDTNYGNVVVYVVDEQDKPKEDDVKEEIKSILVTNKQHSDEKIYYQAFIQLRKDYDLDIFDTELKKMYDETIKQYK